MTKFQDSLKNKMHQYVKLVYHVTKKFPRDELYGVTSQLRRSEIELFQKQVLRRCRVDVLQC